MGLFVAALLLYNLALGAATVLALRRVARRPGAEALLVAPAILLLGLVLAPPMGVVFRAGGFGAIGLFACAVFAHVPAALAGAGWVLRRERPRLAALELALALVVVAVAVDAFVVEPRRLELTRARIESPKVSRPVRIAVLADVQTDRVGAHERRAIGMALAAEPDLVLFAGDYAHTWTREEGRAVRAALRDALAEAGLDPPLGAFAVAGNVDPPRWPEAFEGLGVRCFLGTGTVETGELRLTGLALADSFSTGLSIPATDRFHVVLGHGPDFALGDVRADLLVAGHCHGGQVRLPFVGPLLTLSRVPRGWTSGTREIRPGTRLSVSRGIGMERRGAPRLRFLCPPEVVVIDVVPAPRVSAR